MQLIWLSCFHKHSNIPILVVPNWFLFIVIQNYICIFVTYSYNQTLLIHISNYPFTKKMISNLLLTSYTKHLQPKSTNNNTCSMTFMLMHGFSYREGRDIGVFITLVRKILYQRYLIYWPKSFGNPMELWFSSWVSKHLKH